jgi:hypothetical protein
MSYRSKGQQTDTPDMLRKHREIHPEVSFIYKEVERAMMALANFSVKIGRAPLLQKDP